MNKMIAYCGLNCENCDAYLATINDDQELRIKTAKQWAELNHAPILPEHINCQGCRVDGAKTVFVRGKVILQPHGKEFFTWYSKHLFTLHGKHFFT